MTVNIYMPKMQYGVNATCANCSNEPYGMRLALNDGTEVQVSRCPK